MTAPMKIGYSENIVISIAYLLRDDFSFSRAAFCERGGVESWSSVKSFPIGTMGPKNLVWEGQRRLA